MRPRSRNTHARTGGMRHFYQTTAHADKLLRPWEEARGHGADPAVLGGASRTRGILVFHGGGSGARDTPSCGRPKVLRVTQICATTAAISLLRHDRVASPSSAGAAASTVRHTRTAPRRAAASPAPALLRPSGTAFPERPARNPRGRSAGAARPGAPDAFWYTRRRRPLMQRPLIKCRPRAL